MWIAVFPGNGEMHFESINEKDKRSIREQLNARGYYNMSAWHEMAESADNVRRMNTFVLNYNEWHDDHNE